MENPNFWDEREERLQEAADEVLKKRKRKRKKIILAII